jgi:hypothetical protein
LIDKGFFVDASTMLAPCLQDAIPERETETEREVEKKPVFEIPDWLPKEAWKDWCDYRRSRKNSFTEKAKTLAIAALAKLKDDGDDPVQVINRSIQNGWTGLFALPKDTQKTAAQPAGSDWMKSNRIVRAK